MTPDLKARATAPKPLRWPKTLIRDADATAADCDHALLALRRCCGTNTPARRCGPNLASATLRMRCSPPGATPLA